MKIPRRVKFVRMQFGSPINWVRCQKSPRIVPGIPNTCPLLNNGKGLIGASSTEGNDDETVGLFEVTSQELLCPWLTAGTTVRTGLEMVGPGETSLRESLRVAFVSNATVGS